jgi:hypothetical protein
MQEMRFATQEWQRDVVAGGQYHRVQLLLHLWLVRKHCTLWREANNIAMHTQHARTDTRHQLGVGGLVCAQQPMERGQAHLTHVAAQ